MSGRLWVVTYDIAHAKRWRKVFTLLKRYGRAVQYSVFECELSDAQFRSLHAGLKSLINHDEDRVNFYPLCGQCTPRIEVLGCGGRLEGLPDVWIISDAKDETDAHDLDEA